MFVLFKAVHACALCNLLDTKLSLKKTLTLNPGLPMQLDHWLTALLCRDLVAKLNNLKGR